MAKAVYLLHCHSLKQKEGEPGAEFVDCEQRKCLALREIGINVKDSPFFKIHPTWHNKHEIHIIDSNYIFNGVTLLGRVTSLFENCIPVTERCEPVVNALFCKYCKGNDHKKTTQRKELSRPEIVQNSSFRISVSKKSLLPCTICEALDRFTHLCPRKPEIKKCLGKTRTTMR